MFTYCPHCGAKDTMKKSGEVFVEEGVLAVNEYTHEATVDKCRCTACGGAAIENGSDFDLDPESAYEELEELGCAAEDFRAEIESAIARRDASDYGRAKA